MNSYVLSKNTWMVFDVDGVLVDPGESYDIAVKYTVSYLLSGKMDSVDLDENSIRELRKVGRFGDDFDLTEVIVRGIASGKKMDDILREFPHGEGIEWAREHWKVYVSREELEKVFNTFYLGELYEERIFEFEGLWRRDRVMVDRTLLEEADRRYFLGVITGRDALELSLACKLIGFHFRRYITREMYVKPDPMCLKALVGDMEGIYVGDTVNDELLVKRYNDEFGGNFEFAMIGRDFEDINEFLRSKLT